MCEKIYPKNRRPKTTDIIKNEYFERNNRSMPNLKIQRQKTSVRLLFKKNIRNKNQIQYSRQKTPRHRRNNQILKALL